MIIEKISFLNVRNTKQANYFFSNKTNIIIGNNGAGKTTVLEAIFLLSTTKSFRKKYNQTIIKKGEKELKIKGTFLKKTNQKQTIELQYNNNKKIFQKNEKTIKKTSELLESNPIVCFSPEETDVIETHRSEKIKYFDKIIFKINTKHIKIIKEYNKILLYRNLLLENKKETDPWDTKLIAHGKEIWKTRKEFFKYFLKIFLKTQNKIINKEKFLIKYIYQKPENYLRELKTQKNKEKTQTDTNKDNLIFTTSPGSGIKEYASQGEKTLFKYILKLTEAEVLKQKKNTRPIILLDDFFAKLDNEKIMKIFLYFHCKFQAIITTTKEEEKKIKTHQIKTIECQ